MISQEIPSIPERGSKGISVLGLETHPVGVRLHKQGDTPSLVGDRLQQYRYCQVRMKARRGANVILDGSGIAYPAAAAAFGFRPLPEGLKSGQWLVGIGIVSDPAVGQRMFEEMPRLEPGQIQELELFPML